MKKDVIRTGRVSSIDYAAGTYEVTYFDRDQSVTRKINAVSNGEYRMPRIGDIVSVSHNSNGTAAGTSNGSIWNQSNRPAEGYPGLYRKEYSNTEGQAFDRYDANTGTFTQYVDKRTGRNCNGEIFDEAKGAASYISGGQMQIGSSKGSTSVSAGKGVGITAGADVSIEAGGAVSIESGADMSISAGGNRTADVSGNDEEVIQGSAQRQYQGSTQRQYQGKLTEELQAGVEQTVTGGVEQSVSGNVQQEITGNVQQAIQGEVTRELTGNETKTTTGNVTENVTGDVTKTIFGTTVINLTGDVTINANGAVIAISAGGDLSLTSPTQISLNAPVVNIEGASGTVEVNSISLTEHKHKSAAEGEESSKPLP